MNIAVHLQLDNLPDDTDLDAVESVIRRPLNEWLDLGRHPEDPEITCRRTA